MNLILFLIAFIFPLFAVQRDAAIGSYVTVPPDALTVIIDAGHGGTDLGARGRTPYCEEKRVCLQTARLVKKYLNQLGYHVVMTRNSDAFISLSRRVEIADQASGALFVSLHFNSSRNPTAQGIEVFFYENKEDRSRTSASRKLADAVLGRLVRRTAAVSRGTKKGNFYVIRETTMPAILVEGGFISNPSERTNLKSREYQEKIARGVADGIDAFMKKNKF